MLCWRFGSVVGVESRVSVLFCSGCVACGQPAIYRLVLLVLVLPWFGDHGMVRGGGGGGDGVMAARWLVCCKMTQCVFALFWWMMYIISGSYSKVGAVGVSTVVGLGCSHLLLIKSPPLHCPPCYFPSVHIFRTSVAVRASPCSAAPGPPSGSLSSCAAALALFSLFLLLSPRADPWTTASTW